MKKNMTTNDRQGTCARTLIGRLAASLLLLAGLVTAVPAQAQSVLVSNLAEVETGTSFSGTSMLHAQGFRTGGAPTVLSSVTVKLSTRFNNQHLPDMTLHRGSAHSPSIATLTKPSSPINMGTANHTYTAPTNALLSPSTSYYVVLTPVGKSEVSPRFTRSTGEDTAATGWSIKDRRRWKPIFRFPGAYFDRRGPIKIEVRGTAQPTLSITTVPVRDSDNARRRSHYEGESVDLTVALSETVTTDVTVKWRFVPGTATADDYSITAGKTLTIPAGQTSTTLTVALTDDTRHENPESFSVELYDASGAELLRRRATVHIDVDSAFERGKIRSEGAGTDKEDPDWPRVTVSGIPDTVVDTSSETTFTVQVKQENPSDVGDFTVGIYTVGGTAQAPGDFTYLARELSFPKGTTTDHTVDISVVNDALTEGRETFEIRLGIPTIVGTYRCCVQSAHTVTILDSAIDSSTVSMQVAAPTITGSPTLSESGTDGAWAAGATVEATLTFSEAVTVDTAGGTPSIGLDLGGTESRSAPYLRGSGTTALVFAYTLTATDGSHTSLLVPIDSLALNGGAIRSQATSADAALSHNGAAKAGSTGGLGNRGDSGTQDEGDPFTARFGALPQNHNGSDAFTFELHFSEAPEGLSYTTVAGGLLDVTGATVTKARRLTAGSNLGWEVTVTPSQSGDIAIRLPARACTDTNAVCVGGSPLGKAVSATVPGVPFTASFSGVPAEHDGTAFDIRFHLSAEPAGLSYRTVQNGLFDVTGGSIEKASRLNAGKNNGWTLRIDPSGFGDVTVRVKPTTACDTAPGVCTADGRKLAGGLQVLIAGPAVLSVADAEVEEAEGALLDFVVTLSKSRYTATTVDYATSDGTATAGSDYTETSGTVTFGPLETTKTVSVAVIDDSHDEGSETMTLTLSNPSGARLGDSTATGTGTINNTDAMPRAWMVRFGRTVGSQVVDALTQRLDGAGASHVTFAGINLIGESGVELQAENDDPFGPPEWATDASREADVRTITADNLLLRSAFHLSSGGGGAQGGGPAFTAWGRVSTGGFDAEEDDITIDGDVTTGLVGFDAEWERALAGIMLSQSSGDGAYRGDDAGTVENSLTGVYPYARIDLNAKVSAWALAGVGSGELTPAPGGREANAHGHLNAHGRDRNQGRSARRRRWRARDEREIRCDVGRHEERRHERVRPDERRRDAPAVDPPGRARL